MEREEAETATRGRGRGRVRAQRRGEGGGVRGGVTTGAAQAPRPPMPPRPGHGSAAAPAGGHASEGEDDVIRGSSDEEGGDTDTSILMLPGQTPRGGGGGGGGGGISGGAFAWMGRGAVHVEGGIVPLWLYGCVCACLGANPPSPLLSCSCVHVCVHADATPEASQGSVVSSEEGTGAAVPGSRARTRRRAEERMPVKRLTMEWTPKRVRDRSLVTPQPASRECLCCGLYCGSVCVIVCGVGSAVALCVRVCVVGCAVALCVRVCLVGCAVARHVFVFVVWAVLWLGMCACV